MKDLLDRIDSDCLSATFLFVSLFITLTICGCLIAITSHIVGH